MDYKEFQTPFLSDKDIKKKVNLFRKKYWGDIIPVNIEIIIEEKLSIEIIPVPGLKLQCNTDAFISSDWKSVFVDNKKYMDESYYNRLRFSIAHEIGHLVLHKELYKSLGIESLEDFRDFLSNVDGKHYGYIETQANKFANHFLIPREILEKERKLILINYKEIADIDSRQVNGYIATPLGKKFGVSMEAMEIALNSENYD